jgi:hypothetical protein
MIQSEAWVDVRTRCCDLSCFCTYFESAAAFQTNGKIIRHIARDGFLNVPSAALRELGA